MAVLTPQAFFAKYSIPGTPIGTQFIEDLRDSFLFVNQGTNNQNPGGGGGGTFNVNLPTYAQLMSLAQGNDILSDPVRLRLATLETLRAIYNTGTGNTAIPQFGAMQAITATNVSTYTSDLIPFLRDQLITRVGGNNVVVFNSTGLNLGFAQPGSLTTAGIDNGAITTAKIDDDAITTAKIDDDAITTAKIDDDAVNQSKLSTNSVGVNELLNNSVTSQKILNGAVIEEKIAGHSSNDSFRAISRDKIKSGAVTNSKIANNTIQENTIRGVADETLDGQRAITTHKIRNGAVTNRKIADGAITEQKIVGAAGQNNGAVTTIKIRNGAITTEKIADGAITEQKIVGTAGQNNGAVTTIKIRNGAITSEKIADGAITEGKISGHATQDNLRAVTTIKIRNGAITSEKIADGAITEGKISGHATQDNLRAVTTIKIRNGAITTEKIGNRQVTGLKIATENIQQGHFVNNAVSNRALDNDAVQERNIADNQIVDRHFPAGQLSQRVMGHALLSNGVNNDSGVAIRGSGTGAGQDNSQSNIQTGTISGQDIQNKAIGYGKLGDSQRLQRNDPRSQTIDGGLAPALSATSNLVTGALTYNHAPRIFLWLRARGRNEASYFLNVLVTTIYNGSIRNVFPYHFQIITTGGSISSSSTTTSAVTGASFIHYTPVPNLRYHSNVQWTLFPEYRCATYHTGTRSSIVIEVANFHADGFQNPSSAARRLAFEAQWWRPTRANLQGGGGSENWLDLLILQVHNPTFQQNLPVGTDIFSSLTFFKNRDQIEDEFENATANPFNANLILTSRIFRLDIANTSDLAQL